MLTADSTKAFSLWVPHAFRFLVIQHKGVFIGPARRSECKDGAVNRTAVHSRQVDQWSVTGCDGLPSDCGVGDFMSPEAIN